MQLTLRLGDKSDLDWAQKTVTEFHYLRQPVHPQARPMAYIVWGETGSGQPKRLGLCMVGIPHATLNKRWWGYEGQPTQWQVADLSRVWLSPAIQQGGAWCTPDIVPGFTDRKGVFRPTTATWLIGQVLQRVQVDRLSMWPPVYPDQPYHIELVIAYHDPKFHKGTIYRLSNAEPMYVDKDGRACPGSTGKYGWCWRLPVPMWEWQDIDILRPRTLRMF